MKSKGSKKKPFGKYTKEDKLNNTQAYRDYNREYMRMYYKKNAKKINQYYRAWRRKKREDETYRLKDNKRQRDYWRKHVRTARRKKK